jgi:hemerythrin
MSAEQFSQIFREEHRVVRDSLFDLIQAFRDRDAARAQSLLGSISSYAGKHFRYEEESLYPALVDVFGPEYIEKLFSDHDRVIKTAEDLVSLSQDQITDDKAEEAVGLVRSILPHVSDCDGLSIMVERLPVGKVQNILDRRQRSLEENLDLFAWARQVRSRPAFLSKQSA